MLHFFIDMIYDFLIFLEYKIRVKMMLTEILQMKLIIKYSTSNHDMKN